MKTKSSFESMMPYEGEKAKGVRKTWGTLRPVTKVKPSAKTYRREATKLNPVEFL